MRSGRAGPASDVQVSRSLGHRERKSGSQCDDAVALPSAQKVLQRPSHVRAGELPDEMRDKGVRLVEAEQSARRRPVVRVLECDALVPAGFAIAIRLAERVGGA